MARFTPKIPISTLSSSDLKLSISNEDWQRIESATSGARQVDIVRTGQSAVVKAVSATETRSTDTHILKGFSQALDRPAQECK
jgi:hypothetical protein